MERLKRRWWTAAVTVAASLVVLAAVTSGLFQIAVMALPGYRQQLSDYISKLAERPVDVGGVALAWHGLAPQLLLSDIVLYGEDGETPALSANRVGIGFGLLRLLRGDSFPDRIEVSGLEVVVEIDADNHVQLRGLDTRRASPVRQDWPRELARFDAVVLEDCAVLVDDARLVGGTPAFRIVKASARQRSRGASFDAFIELPAFMGEAAELEGRVEGDLSQLQSLQGQWTLAFSGLKRLPWLEARLPGHPRLAFQDGELELGGPIEQGRVQRFDVALHATAVAAQRARQRAQLTAVSVRASARYTAPHWNVEVPEFQVTGDSGPWPDTRLRLRWSPLDASAGRTRELEADADYLRLQDLVPWLMLSPDPAARRLAGISGELRGLVTRLQLAPGKAPVYSLRARLEQLGRTPQLRAPGFSGLSGEFSATEAGGQLALDAPGFTLDYASVFAQPVRFDKLQARVDYRRDAGGWRVEIPDYVAVLEGAQAEGDLSLLLPDAPEASPEIALVTRFSAADATRLKPYKPRHWHENLRNWLDRAIVAGRIAGGELRLQGRLADFPFRDKPGVFTVSLDVADGRLAYAPDWPMADRIQARLRFEHGGMTLKSEAARIAGSRVEALSAAIPDFRDSVLTLDGELQGEAARYYDFLRASPLKQRLSGLLDRTQASGPVTAYVHIELPLRDLKQSLVSGRIRPQNAQLLYRGLEEPFRDISGELFFDDDGVSARNVGGSFYGTPVRADLTALGRGTSRLDAAFDYAVQPDGSGLSRYVPELLRARLPGSAHWRARAQLGGRGGDGGVTLSSDLRGVTVDLPPPLGKAAEAPAALAVRLDGDDAQGLTVGVTYDGRLGAHAVFRPVAGRGLQAERVLLQLGASGVPRSVEPGLRIIGHIDELDLPAWLTVLGVGTPPGVEVPAPVPPAQPQAGLLPGPDTEAGLRLEAAQIHTDRLQLAGYVAQDVNLSYAPQAQGWSSMLSGGGAQGAVHWSRLPTPRLDVQLDHLRVSAHPSAAEAGQPTAAAQPIDPNHVPILDVEVRALQLGRAALGRLRLVTERVEGGQRLQTLSVDGGELDLKAQGDWLRRDGASIAQVRFEGESRSIAEVLKGMGYADNISAQRARFKGELAWSPSARGLDWAQAQGPIEFEIENGTLRAVEPGAGRVLGLINFYALPRRLMLDFRDVVSKGLRFDTVKGRFDLAGGDAFTRGLQIASPSLKIEMSGRVGLAARDYDQRVRVYPGVSSGVTLGALLLGGPAAGALALIAQQVLDKPLDQVTQLSYQVTGSWDNPQVRRGDEMVSPPPVSRSPPAGKPAAADGAIMPERLTGV